MRSVVVWATLGLAGCNLGGNKPKYDYFVLTSQVKAAPVDAAGGPVLVVRKVTLPDYLERDSIATRESDHRVTYSSRDRWAEPLERGFARTVRQDLAALLAPAGIVVETRSPAARADYTVELEVLRYERRADARVELWVRWRLNDRDRLLHSGETRVMEEMERNDSEAATAALSRAVAQLGRDIAAAMPAVAPEPTP